jgi:calcineurin-like phosphoesterase family protein
MITADNLWITSDTHYAHNNICRGVSNWGKLNGEGVFEVDENVTRDFENLEVMNNAIVDNINDVVNENDYLVHLGDWSFGGFEKIQEFRERINCKNIILLLGNHDHHIQRDKDKVRKLFTLVSNYEEMKVKGIGSFVLCHYPIISWNGLRKGVYMLHGHQHLKGDDKFGKGIDGPAFGKRMDVGMDGSPEFRPYHIEEAVKLLDDHFCEKPDLLH